MAQRDALFVASGDQDRSVFVHTFNCSTERSGWQLTFPSQPTTIPASSDPPSTMYVIGLTGNIGTGKSTVLGMLQRLGARTADADRLAHEVVEPGEPAYRAIIDEFGAQVVAPDGRIDRRRLGEIVFADPSRLKRLEELTHPAVTMRIGEIIASAQEPVVVIEAIKLIEAGGRSWCNAVWVVVAPPEQQVARLVTARGMAEAEARQRLAVQGSIAPKLALADVVIDNSGTVEDTWRQVKEAWERTVPTTDGEHEGRDVGRSSLRR